MAKADNKTVATPLAMADYLASLPDPRRRDEGLVLDALFRRVTGCQPVMWGPSIIGYGQYHYRYDSGREGTMCRAGFSPRQAALTLYAMGGPAASAEGQSLLARLGKHSTGKSCLYIKMLSQIDLAVLEELVALSWAMSKATWPA